LRFRSSGSGEVPSPFGLLRLLEGDGDVEQERRIRLVSYAARKRSAATAYSPRTNAFCADSNASFAAPSDLSGVASSAAGAATAICASAKNDAATNTGAGRRRLNLIQA
jgi:hypothetical protein